MSGNPLPGDMVARLWRQAGLGNVMPDISFRGADPVLPSSFRIGTAAAASIGAAGLAAAEIHHRRGGIRRGVSVDLRHAATEFRSERHLRINGAPPEDPWDRIAGLYRAGDGRFVRLHTNFPHHRDGVLRLLGCAYERDAVAAALAGWQAGAFEDAAAQAGLTVAAARDFDEWDAHPQGQAVARLPVLEISRIGDAAPTPLPAAADRPLAGLRVLDLTRVIAGPVCGRALAAHGAEVLHITAPHLPSIGPLVADTGRGKLSAQLDLRNEQGRAALLDLARGADVFVQSYRPGALAARGFSPQALAAARPGIVAVSLSAYGHAGPWSDRRGFDSLVQTATGVNLAEGDAAGTPGQPRVLPCQALDHASGYLMAFGAMAALMRRAEEGGSWLVRVSLAGTGRWLRQIGRLDAGLDCPDPGHEDVADLLETGPSGFGELTAVRHSAILPATPAHWALPSVPLGTHAAAWGGGEA